MGILLVVAAMVVVIALPVIFLWLWLRHRRWTAGREGRRHPLKASLLRPPGYTTGKIAEEALIDVLSCFWAAIVSPLLVALIYLAPTAYTGVPPSTASTLFAIVFAIALIVSSLYQLRQTLAVRRRYRLGWEGELATAEGLAPLQGMGYRVFHDLPAKGFNIDHVLIGPNGVFAIETKARVKRGTDKNTHKVIYDGKTLKFPNRAPDDRAIEQARRQAADLGKWLSRAAQISITPVAIVSIPGWFVDRTVRGEVLVMTTTGMSSYIPKIRTTAVLNAQQIEAIAYFVEERCRDVALSGALI